MRHYMWGMCTTFSIRNVEFFCARTVRCVAGCAAVPICSGHKMLGLTVTRDELSRTVLLTDRYRVSSREFLSYQ